VHPGDPDTGVLGEPQEAAGGCVPVHPGAAAAEQDRPAGPCADGAVDRPADCWWQRDQDDLAALAADPQHPVAVLLAQISNSGTGGLEDPQAQQAEHGHQGEVVVVGGLASGGKQCLKLQVREPEHG